MVLYTISYFFIRRHVIERLRNKHVTNTWAGVLCKIISVLCKTVFGIKKGRLIVLLAVLYNAHPNLFLCPTVAGMPIFKYDIVSIVHVS